MLPFTMRGLRDRDRTRGCRAMSDRLRIMLVSLLVAACGALVAGGTALWTNHSAGDAAIVALAVILVGTLLIVRLHGPRRDMSQRRLREAALEERAEQFRLVTDAMPAMIAHLDTGFVVRFANRQFAEWFGLTPEQTIGRDIREVVGEGVFATREESLRLALAGHRTTNLRATLSVDGQPRHVESTYLPHFGEDGGVRGLYILGLDVTERQRTEEALRAGAEQFRLVTDAVPAMIGYYGTDLTVRFANRQFAEWFGLAPEQVIGRQIRELMGEKAFAAREEGLRLALAGHRKTTLRLSLSVDGQPRHIESTYVPHFGEDGGVRGLYVLVLDVTEHRRTEAALRVAAEQFRLVTDAVPATIAYYGTDLRVRFCNRRHARHFGRSVEEVIGKHIRDLIGNNAFARLGPHYGEALAGREATFEAARPTAEGDLRTLQIRLVPQLGDAGEVEGVFALSVDVTELKRAEADLRRTRGQLTEAIDSMSDGFVLWDKDDRLILCNSRFLDFYPECADMLRPGVSYEEVLRAARGTGSVKATTLTDHPLYSEEWLRLRLEAHRDPADRFEIELADGRWVQVNDRRTAEGSFVGTRSDITALKAAQRALGDSEARYRGLVDLSPDAILIHQGGCLTFANPALLRMVGVADETALSGRSVLDIVHPDDRVLARHRVNSVLESGAATLPAEMRVLQADGNIVFTEAIATCLGTGEDRSVMVLLRDITGRKRREEERATLEEQLHRAQRMEALGTLAGGIAHDFNNVLVPMIGLTELTMDSLPEDSLDRSNLDKVVQAGVRARDLVEQILAFSRQESTERRVVDLGEVVDEAMKLLGSTTPRTIALRHSIEPGLPPIFADPGNLHQVIVNLANNAVYAIGEGHGTVAVTLKRVALDNASDAVARGLPPGLYAELSVRDSGCGISPEAMARIFEPFFTTKPVGEGTGLGLSIIHGIVASHGGLISVDSELGKGTIFTIHLPFWNGEQTTGQAPMELLAATG